jgi:CheY-like chemotaxis protein
MEKPLILVVDDEKDVADSIVETINNTGNYQVIKANSAKEAFENINKNKIMLGIGGNKIKLILLDIKMPDMDGLQFLEKLRKTYDEEEIGVIMVTAFEDNEKWDKATSGFVAGYINKPFREKQLLENLEKYFSSEKKKFDMVLDTFGKHIDKQEELRKKSESEL